MSREDVMKALQEIKEQYGASVIDITPVEKEAEESRIDVLPSPEAKSKEASS